MGKGKGKVRGVVANIYRGQIVLEFNSIGFFLYKKYILSAKAKLPVRSKMVFFRNKISNKAVLNILHKPYKRRFLR